MDATSGQPVEMLVQLQPFGKWIGNISTHYDTFSASRPDPANFLVTNTKYCQKGSDDQCDNVDAIVAQASNGLTAVQKK